MPYQLVATASGGGTQLLLASSSSSFLRDVPPDRIFDDGFELR